MAKEKNTFVEEVEFDNLDDLLGTSASTVIVPDDTNKSVLSTNKVDTTFIDNPEDEEEEEEEEDDLTGKKSKTETSEEEEEEEEDLSFLNEELEEEEDDASKPGRKKQTKEVAISVLSSLVEKGILEPFVDQDGNLEKPIEEYTQKDIEELIEANIQDKIKKVAEDAPLRVFSTLPEDVQQVVNYALNGGQDTKAIYKILSQTQEVYELSLDKEEDQEKIVRQWMQSQDWGTTEEIENEIQDLKDSNKLKQKAEVFKPKLDAKQASIVQAKLAAQAKAQELAIQASKSYVNDVFETLKKGELNGIKLDDKIQNMLYFGLVDKSKFNDRQGNPTNELGYLLEQYQFGEKKDLSVINEVLWLMKDPKGYKNAISKQAVLENNKKTTRALRTAENVGIKGSSSPVGKETSPTLTRTGGVNKKERNIFSRS